MAVAAPGAETASGRTERDPVHVEVRDLRLVRGERTVFGGLSCAFLRDRITVVLGGSGSGKTTLLRVLGGLTPSDSGEVWVDGDLEVTGLGESQVRDFRRRVGMMFQHGALLDAMTVFDNVALPLREHTTMSEAVIRREVHEVFESVGLREVDALLPAQLSGGMIKRAALARALILAPSILMCDEPFSGLDPRTVRKVEWTLRELNRKRSATMIITSHHIPSTLRLADRIVLLVDAVAFSGTADELLHHRDERVVEFFADEKGAPR